MVEGLRLLDLPAFGVQYHPEAAPGPHDAAGLFDGFGEQMGAGQVSRPRPLAGRGGARRAQA